MTTSDARSLIVESAHEEDRPVLEQLWTMFRHDMSAFSGVLPDERGRFRQERLDAALADPNWAAYVFRLGSSPAGLALVRALESPERVISSFFLVNAARRQGYGRAAVHMITRKHPGRWAVAFQDSNTAAAAFWRSIASEADEHWTLAHHDVPGNPLLPPDSWIRFVAPRR